MRIDAQRNRQLLLAAARDAFVDQGPHAPLESIARRAGVGIGTLYRHFPGRSALLRAVAEDVMARTAAAARAALDEEPTGFDALRRYLHDALDVGIAVMNRIHGEIDKDAEYRGWSDAAAGALGEILDRARSEGTLRPDAEFGDVGLALVRFTRPIGAGFDPALERPLAHRQLDVYIDGLRNPHADGLDGSTTLASEAALPLEGLRRMGGR
jgi:AcrR family transcriptional regulator